MRNLERRTEEKAIRLPSGDQTGSSFTAWASAREAATLAKPITQTTRQPIISLSVVSLFFFKEIDDCGSAIV
jgi:hypothetical protein